MSRPINGSFSRAFRNRPADDVGVDGGELSLSAVFEKLPKIPNNQKNPPFDQNRRLEPKIYANYHKVVVFINSSH